MNSAPFGRCQCSSDTRSIGTRALALSFLLTFGRLAVGLVEVARLAARLRRLMRTSGRRLLVLASILRIGCALALALCTSRCLLGSI